MLQRALLPALLIGSLLGCADDPVHRLPDGPGPEPTEPTIPTEPTDPEPTGEIAVEVSRFGVPVAEIITYVLEPDGALAGTATTGADGIARHALVRAGATVVVVDPFGTIGEGDHDVRVWTGVAPGDRLALAEAAMPEPGSVRLLIPTDGDRSDYQVDIAGCPPVITNAGDLEFAHDGCATANAPAVITSLDATGSPARSLRYGDATYRAPSTIDLAVASDLPVAIRHQQLTPHGLIGGDFALGGGRVAYTELPGAAIVQRATATSALARHELVRWNPDEPRTLDTRGAFLADLASPPMWDPAQHALHWTPGSGGAVPNVAIAQIYGHTTTTNTTWQLTIVAGDGPAALVIPSLGGPLAAYELAGADELRVRSLTLARLPGGYDAVRGAVLAAPSFDAWIDPATSGDYATETYAFAAVDGR